MNRVLKFRAWDKIGKKFLLPYPEGFHLLGETTCFDLIGQQLKERTPEKTTLEMLDDVEITLFTGLLDKNGKEMCEGDRVRFTFFYYAETEREIDKVGIIEFNGLSFIFKVNEEEFYTISELEFDSETDIEIIGNIYENPELIGK